MAKLKYTFENYMNSPSGKGGAVFSNSNAIREQYQKELISLESKNARSTYNIYRQSLKAGKVGYIIHFQIPSTTKDFFHDVVIEFTPNTDDTPTTKSIKLYTVKFFANDSNFVYTYAYTFKSHGVLITELEKLLPFRSIMQKPIMRNPDNAMGYSKYIVFAYIIMERDNLFLKENLNRIAKNAGINIIRSSILSFDKKEQERNKITREAKEKAKKEKIIPKNKVIKSKNLLGDSSSNQPPKLSKLTGFSKKTSTVSSVKKTKKR